MSIVLGGVIYEIPGLETKSFINDPSIPQATDTNRRTQRIRAIVVHTVHGKLGPLRPGSNPSQRAERYARYQANTTRSVSWDFTVDSDGTVVQSNDPLLRVTWQAGSNAINEVSLGIEIVQDQDNTMYEASLDALVKLVIFLCEKLGIQAQVPVYQGRPDRRKLTRLMTGDRGRDVVGVYGHRNCANNRGAGDPGDFPFEFLLRAGFEGYDFQAEQDKVVWRQRQTELGVPADGVPLTQTVEALQRAGRANGLWVQFAKDDLPSSNLAPSPRQASSSGTPGKSGASSADLMLWSAVLGGIYIAYRVLKG